MSRALLKLQRRLDSRLRNHLRRFPEPELRVARAARRHESSPFLVETVYGS